MFVKIFSKIFDSSIAENWKARVTFMDLLVLADRDGIVDMTLEAIARRTNTPIEFLREGLEVLSAPDPHSRNAEDDGKRIELIDEHRAWGWKIVNYTHYRDLRSSEQMRESNRVRVARHRAKKKGVTLPVTPSNDGKRLSPHAEAEAEAYSLPPNPKGGLESSSSSNSDVEPKAGKLTLAMIRIGKLLGRKDGTRWSPKEIKAAKAVLPVDEEDMQLLERFYFADIPKPEDFRRTTLMVLLNNFAGEIDKARNFNPGSNRCF